jgi:hypothetical protein
LKIAVAVAETAVQAGLTEKTIDEDFAGQMARSMYDPRY